MGELPNSHGRTLTDKSYDIHGMRLLYESEINATVQLQCVSAVRCNRLFAKMHLFGGHGPAFLLLVVIETLFRGHMGNTSIHHGRLYFDVFNLHWVDFQGVL